MCVYVCDCKSVCVCVCVCVEGGRGGGVELVATRNLIFGEHLSQDFDISKRDVFEPRQIHEVSLTWY